MLSTTYPVAARAVGGNDAIQVPRRFMAEQPVSVLFFDWALARLGRLHLIVTIADPSKQHFHSVCPTGGGLAFRPVYYAIAICFVRVL